MKAWITQENLVNEWQGYAWVLIYPEETPATQDDRLILGYCGADAVHYLIGGTSRWAPRPQPLMIQAQPTADGAGLQFLLSPEFVNALIDGTYVICLADASGQPRGAVHFGFYDIVYPVTQFGMPQQGFAGGILGGVMGSGLGSLVSQATGAEGSEDDADAGTKGGVASTVLNVVSAFTEEEDSADEDGEEEGGLASKLFGLASSFLSDDDDDD